LVRKFSQSTCDSSDNGSLLDVSGASKPAVLYIHFLLLANTNATDRKPVETKPNEQVSPRNNDLDFWFQCTDRSTALELFQFLVRNWPEKIDAQDRCQVIEELDSEDPNSVDVSQDSDKKDNKCPDDWNVYVFLTEDDVLRRRNVASRRDLSAIMNLRKVNLDYIDFENLGHSTRTLQNQKP